MSEQLDQDTPPPSPEDLVDVRLLPPALRMLCGILGHRKAFELCRQRGGVPLCVPAEMSLDHHLVGIIGMDGMAALVAELGRQVIEVPKYDSVAKQLRHRTVHALLNQGKGPTTVALATGYSKRQITNLKRGLVESDGLLNTQADLFGFLPAEQQLEIQVALAQAEPIDDEQIPVVDDEPDEPITAIDDEHKAVAQAHGMAHNPFGI